MAKPVQMPALSPTMKEGKITKWRKKVGDKVSSGEALAEVETDKSNLEIEAYDDGFLIAILVEENGTAPVGSPIAYIGKQGEKVDAGAAGAGKPSAPAPAAAPAKPSAPPAAPTPPAPRQTSGGGGGGGGKRAKPVLMPALSPTMKEGKITKWLKKEGDKVSSGEPIAEVETDKSNLQIEAYDDGLLLKIQTGENETAPVGSPIAFVGQKGDEIITSPEEPRVEKRSGASNATQEASAQKQPAAAAQAPKPPAKGDGQVVPLRREGGGGAERGGRIVASPLAKRIARDRGVDLGSIQGSGPNGRIVKRDVEAAIQAGGTPKKAAAAPAAPAFAARAAGPRPEPRRVELSTMRRVIAQRMGEVKPGVPHFYLTMDIEMDAALKIREEAKAVDAKISVNDIIVKAMAIALRRVPKVNVSWNGDHILQYETADVGVAVSIEDGLITPVVRDVDQKGLVQISAEVKDLADRARSRKLRPEEYSGGAITISNLGMYGIDNFGAVINPPQGSILAVGAATDKVVVRDGQMVVRKIMTATMSCDHRVIDGALGAQYLKELKDILEHPLRLLF